MIRKTESKYYYKDGNGLDLILGDFYIDKSNDKELLVLEEYTDYYVVEVDGKYKTTIDKRDIKYKKLLEKKEY